AALVRGACTGLTRARVCVRIAEGGTQRLGLRQTHAELRGLSGRTGRGATGGGRAGAVTGVAGSCGATVVGKAGAFPGVPILAHGAAPLTSGAAAVAHEAGAGGEAEAEVDRVVLTEGPRWAVALLTRGASLRVGQRRAVGRLTGEVVGAEVRQAEGSFSAIADGHASSVDAGATLG